MDGTSKNISAPLRIGLITIGCRANQADTSRMVSSLSSEGSKFAIQSEPDADCDIVIVNTCAVTSRAEADARKLIRRTKRKHPDATIIVTGCAAQIDGDKWASMPEVDTVLGISERDRIEDFISLSTIRDPIHVGDPGGGIGGSTPLHGHRSRPFLKIQDGCSRGCAYCIVPLARGVERSRPPELIRQDIHNLHEAGYREIVLTGVHLGRWGRDIGSDFSGLLDLLDEIKTDVRIRLSSLEPMDMTKDHIERMLSSPRICPHLHLPLQSGDQGILDAMGRGHSPDDFVKLIEAAIRVEPDVCIGTDIMVGFPGENNKSHQNTINLINDLSLAYMHIFTFSPRYKTRAAGMPDRPPGEIIHDRMKALKELDSAKREAFRHSQAGKTREFLIESPATPSGRTTALSDNFIRIIIHDPAIIGQAGQVMRLVIDNNI